MCHQESCLSYSYMHGKQKDLDDSIPHVPPRFLSYHSWSQYPFPNSLGSAICLPYSHGLLPDINKIKGAVHRMNGRHAHRTCWAENTHSSYLDYQVAEKCFCKRDAETYIAIMTCSLNTLLTQTTSPYHLMTTSSHADFLHKDTTNMTEF